MIWQALPRGVPAAAAGAVRGASSAVVIQILLRPAVGKLLRVMVMAVLMLVLFLLMLGHVVVLPLLMVALVVVMVVVSVAPFIHLLT